MTFNIYSLSHNYIPRPYYTYCYISYTDIITISTGIFFHTINNLFSDYDNMVFMKAYVIKDLKGTFLKKNFRFLENEKDNLFDEHGIIYIYSHYDKSIYTKNDKYPVTDTYSRTGKLLSSIPDVPREDPTYNKLSYLADFVGSYHNIMDSKNYKLNLYIQMEVFSVILENRCYTVDPKIYIINDILFITFELVDSLSKTKISKINVKTRRDNFNILDISSYKLGHSNLFVKYESTISDFIYDNIKSFLFKKDYCFSINNNSIINSFILSNDFNESEIITYLNKYSGYNTGIKNIKNLCTLPDYNYYVFDGLSYIKYNNPTVINNILYNGYILESFKMLIILNLYHTKYSPKSASELINAKFEIDIYLSATDVPVISQRLLKHIKELDSFIALSNGIKAEIEKQSFILEENKDKNSKRLEIILSFIAVIGTTEPLNILSEKFDIPFFILALPTLVILTVLLIFWNRKDNKINR